LLVGTREDLRGVSQFGADGLIIPIARIRNIGKFLKLNFINDINKKLIKIFFLKIDFFLNV